MEYTVRKLAQLAGVTTRTLRWYDKLGLLKPGRIGDNGYRYYGPAEVNRLQLILFYRAIGVELAQVKTILDDPSFNRLDALREHLRALQAEEAQIKEMIKTVKQTILTEERKENMADEAKFEALKRRAAAENERKYGREIRQKYGDEEVDGSNAKMMGLTQEQYQEWTRLGDTIKEKLEQAVASGSNPEGEAGKELTRLHRRWLSFSLKGDYDPARHRGIAELYVLDERFQSHYDETVPGCARFLRDAVCCWAK